MAKKLNNKDFMQELTAEKNLFQIYKQARRLPSKKFNNIATGITILLLMLYVLLNTKSELDIANEVRTLSNAGFVFTTQMLAFLLAGFTVAATQIKPELLKIMAQTTEEESQLSFLKYILFSFMYVFAIYMAFAIFCISIKLFASTGGLCSILLSWINIDIARIVKKWLVNVGFVLVGTCFVNSILLLKSFVFNVYHIIMTGIRWELEKKCLNRISSDTDQ